MDVAVVEQLGYNRSSWSSRYLSFVKTTLLGERYQIKPAWRVAVPGDEYLGKDGYWHLRKTRDSLTPLSCVHRMLPCRCKVPNICPICPKADTIWISVI